MLNRACSEYTIVMIIAIKVLFKSLFSLIDFDVVAGHIMGVGRALDWVMSVVVMMVPLMMILGI